MKNRRQNVVTVLTKELAALQNEEAELKRQLATVQAVIKDVKQAVTTLQSATVHLPLSAKIFDAMQKMKRFATASAIADELLKTEEHADVRAIKRDVNSSLARMRKKNAVGVVENTKGTFYGLTDWLDDKGQPKSGFPVTA